MYDLDSKIVGVFNSRELFENYFLFLRNLLRLLKFSFFLIPNPLCHLRWRFLLLEGDRRRDSLWI